MARKALVLELLELYVDPRECLAHLLTNLLSKLMDNEIKILFDVL